MRSPATWPLSGPLSQTVAQETPYQRDRFGVDVDTGADRGRTTVRRLHLMADLPGGRHQAHHPRRQDERQAHDAGLVRDARRGQRDFFGAVDDEHVTPSLSGNSLADARPEALITITPRVSRLAQEVIRSEGVSLRAHAEEIRAAELERMRGRLSTSDQEVVESITSRIVEKLLHLPTVRLKEAAAGADGGSYAQAVRHLFGLGDERE